MFENEENMELSRYKWLIPFVAVILVVSLIMVRCSTDNLKGYTDESSLESSLDSTESTIEEEITEITEEIYVYEDPLLPFTLDIPASWSKINGANNSVTFIDKIRGTQLNVILSDYDPTINNVTEMSLSEDAFNSGMEIREFSKKSNSEYAVSYSDGNYGYIEFVYWDYKAIVKLDFTISMEYYNDKDSNNIIKYINNSFNWAREDPLPENLQLKYVPYGSFEFAYPEDWNYGESSNTIMMTNPEGSAAYSISVNESTQTLENISQVDFINFVSQNKPGFQLKSFNNDGMMISCFGTYSLNGVQLNVQQYIFANGQFEYILSFDTEVEVTSSLSVDIQKMINAFRYFY